MANLPTTVIPCLVGASRAVPTIKEKTEGERETVDGRVELAHMTGRRNSKAAPHQLDKGRADGIPCFSSGIVVRLDGKLKRLKTVKQVTNITMMFYLLTGVHLALVVGGATGGVSQSCRNHDDGTE